MTPRQLELLLEHRSRLERAARYSLSRALRELAHRRAELASAKSCLQGEDRSLSRPDGRAVSSGNWSRWNDGVETAARRVRETARALASARQKIDSCRRDLTRARRAVKAVEVLASQKQRLVARRETIAEQDRADLFFLRVSRAKRGAPPRLLPELSRPSH